MLGSFLAVMWLLGMITANTMGDLIHILLVISVSLLLGNLVAKRQPE